MRGKVQKNRNCEMTQLIYKSAQEFKLYLDKTKFSDYEDQRVTSIGLGDVMSGNEIKHKTTLPEHNVIFLDVKASGTHGNGGSTVVKVLCYKSESRWFDSCWCHWNFSLT